MRIEEAIRCMRKGIVCRCKKRYYAIINKCLYRLNRHDPKEKYVRVCGVANLNGQDFMTEEWESFENLVIVTDGTEIY